MNILVCISRVPDTATRVNVGSDGKSVEKQGVKYIVNPYDELAIEEGLRLREKGEATVTAITVGTDASKDVLRTAYAMGVDKAVLVKADAEPEDSFTIAKNLASYAKELNPDLILMGRQSVDFDSGQMPSMIAEMLDIGSVSVVSKLTVEDGKLTAERDIEGGKEIVEAVLPCVISTQKGLNDPRYPKLPMIMKAKSKPIEEKAYESGDAKIEVIGLALPISQRVGKVVGDSDDEIAEIVKLLHEDSKVI